MPTLCPFSGGRNFRTGIRYPTSTSPSASPWGFWSMLAAGLSRKVLRTGGHSKEGNALVPLSGTYYHLSPVTVTCTYLFPLFEGGALSCSSILLTGPSWDPLFPAVVFNGCVCRCGIFVSSLLLVLDSIGLMCVSGIHSFSERDETYMVSSVSSTCRWQKSFPEWRCDQLLDRPTGSCPQTRTRDLCFLPSSVPPLAIPPL